MRTMKRVAVIMSDQGYYHLALGTWEARPDLATWFGGSAHAQECAARLGLTEGLDHKGVEFVTLYVAL